MGAVRDVVVVAAAVLLSLEQFLAVAARACVHREAKFLRGLSAYPVAVAVKQPFLLVAPQMVASDQHLAVGFDRASYSYLEVDPLDQLVTELVGRVDLVEVAEELFHWDLHPVANLDP